MKVTTPVAGPWIDAAAAVGDEGLRAALPVEGDPGGVGVLVTCDLLGARALELVATTVYTRTSTWSSASESFGATAVRLSLDSALPVWTGWPVLFEVIASPRTSVSCVLFTT